MTVADLRDILGGIPSHYTVLIPLYAAEGSDGNYSPTQVNEREESLERFIPGPVVEIS